MKKHCKCMSSSQLGMLKRKRECYTLQLALYTHSNNHSPKEERDMSKMVGEKVEKGCQEI